MSLIVASLMVLLVLSPSVLVSIIRSTSASIVSSVLFWVSSTCTLGLLINHLQYRVVLSYHYLYASSVDSGVVSSGGSSIVRSTFVSVVSSSVIRGIVVSLVSSVLILIPIAPSWLAKLLNATLQQRLLTVLTVLREILLANQQSN